MCDYMTSFELNWRQNKRKDWCYDANSLDTGVCIILVVFSHITVPQGNQVIPEATQIEFLIHFPPLISEKVHPYIVQDIKMMNAK